MSYLMKYKGTLRLKVEVDQATNDFPKTLKGNNEDIDVYIKCKKGRIFYYGHGVDYAYIPSLGIGRNIIKAISEKLNINIDDYAETRTKKDGSLYLDKDGKPTKFYDYETFYKDLNTSKNLIWDIFEGDSELEFKFKDKDMDIIAEYMQPLTRGANISPFATSNLPKADYEIPLENLAEYKKINDSINQEDKLLLSRITREFISNIPKKYKQFKGKDIKAMQKKSCLKSKEFVHSLGLWDDYIKYLKKEVDKKLNP